MKYYIILTQATSKRLEKEDLTQATVPKSDLNLLAQSLNASFIKYQSCKIQYIDRIRAKLSSTPENWAFARFVSSQLKSDDVVFCPGEEIGIPLANICATKKERPKIVIWFHRITGLKTKLALKVFGISSSVNLSVVSSRCNKYFLNSYLNLANNRILFWWHSVDSNYFVPGFSSLNKTKPIVASIGLEQRDYKLLAAATEKLNVDVKVAGFSQFQARIAKSFPEVMPNNMTNKKYSLSELVNLYHDADVIVIPLKENSGAAGVTVLLEAMSCRKPIICVRTNGLDDYLADEKAIMTVKPGNIFGLQKAIVYLLNNREEAKLRAQRAYDLAWKKHNMESQVEILAKFIRTLELEKPKGLG